MSKIEIINLIISRQTIKAQKSEETMHQICAFINMALIVKIIVLQMQSFCAVRLQGQSTLLLDVE